VRLDVSRLMHYQPTVNSREMHPSTRAHLSTICEEFIRAWLTISARVLD